MECCKFDLCKNCKLTNFQFSLLLNDEDKLLKFLCEHGVLLKAVHCPMCDYVCPITKHGDKYVYRCRQMVTLQKKKRTQCTNEETIFKNTYFHQVLISIIKNCLFAMIWLSRDPPRQTFCENELGLSSHSVVDWSSFSREVLMYWAFKQSSIIGGPNVIVEIDEAKIGKAKYNRGREVKGQWVFGGIERDNPDNMFVVPVPDRSSDTLLRIIKKYIRNGTKIMSDCWKAYDCLKDEGFMHYTVNQSINFVDPDTQAHTQNIERAWRKVRSKVPRYGRKEDHYYGYLAEFMFKRRFPDHRDRIHFFLAAGELYSPDY